MLGESLKVRANRFRESPETSLNVINRLYPRQHLSLHRLIDWSILKNEENNNRDMDYIKNIYVTVKHIVFYVFEIIFVNGACRTHRGDRY